MCQALLAVVPYPIFPPRGLLGLVWSVSLAYGRHVATRFRALGLAQLNAWGLKGGCWHAQSPPVPGSVLGLPVQEDQTMDSAFWGFWYHGVLMVLFPGLRNLGEVWGKMGC